jgi:hypothetical protein
MVRESPVRRDILAKITVAAGLLGLFAIFSGTPAALAAPRTAGAAYRVAAAASPASEAVVARSGFASASSYALARHAFGTRDLASGSDPEVAVKPRQGPGGKNGYNGNVQWGETAEGTWFYATGRLVWNRTGGTSSVWVAITTTAGGYYNYNVGSVSYGQPTKGVNWDVPENKQTIAPPALITVTVCTRTSTSWNCGPDWEAYGPA